jgi:hypothetical protein
VYAKYDVSLCKERDRLHRNWRFCGLPGSWNGSTGTLVVAMEERGLNHEQQAWSATVQWGVLTPTNHPRNNTKTRLRSGSRANAGAVGDGEHHVRPGFDSASFSGAGSAVTALNAGMYQPVRRSRGRNGLATITSSKVMVGNGTEGSDSHQPPWDNVNTRLGIGNAAQAPSRW